MNSSSILYKVEGRLATITLNRPHRKNALDQEALDLLVERIDQSYEDDNVWLVLIDASGADFCTGQDVKQLVTDGNTGDYFEPVYNSLKRNYKPVICLVRGLCLAGGAGIAMGADIRVFSDTARLGWPHAKIGICSIGGPSTLARSVPVNIALEYMFTGDYMGAERAKELNIANHVFPDSDLERKSQDIINSILANAPLSTRAAKRATLSTLSLPYSDAVAKAHAILDELMCSEDAQEGMRAFSEKRKPNWKGR